MAQTDIVQKLQQLRSRYREQLPQRLWEIRDSWDAFMQGQEQSGLAQALYHQLHRLAGSAETFGLPQVSECARRCLDELKPLCQGHIDSLPDASLDICEDSLEQIFDTLWHSAPVRQLQSRKVTPLRPGATEQPPLVLLAMPGDTSLQQLGERLTQKDYPLAIRSKLPDTPSNDVPAKDSPVKDSPAKAYLLDLNLVAPGSESETAALWQGRPVAALADINDFQTRIRAVRAGATTLFTHPFDIAEISFWLDNYCPDVAGQQGRVLLLSGDRAQFPGIESVLSSQGYDVQSVADPHCLLDPLNNFRPDLVLVDHPDSPFSEREIAAAIHVNAKHLALPVIVAADTETPLAYRGQIAWVSPGSHRLLLKIIREQLGRGRLLHSMINRDSLTQLLNHGECQRQLRLAVLRAERQRQALCVAMIDLDHFKHVNDSLGHAWGDRVLKNTARLISRGLRRTDLVARYGGEEFLVILPDTQLDDAREIAENLRRMFADFNHRPHEEALHITLSVGLAAYPEHHSPQFLLHAADEALYQAKRSGRNRIVMAEPGQPTQGGVHG